MKLLICFFILLFLSSSTVPAAPSGTGAYQYCSSSGNWKSMRGAAAPTQPPGCSATTEGKLIYDDPAAPGVMLFCDGIQWYSLTPPAVTCSGGVSVGSPACLLSGSTYTAGSTANGTCPDSTSCSYTCTTIGWGTPASACAPPAPPACPVTSGSVTLTAGTSWPVPCYNTLTVTVNGAGGGGGAALAITAGGTGASGGTTTFGSATPLIGIGGAGGQGTATVRSNGAAGANGTASGGDVNTSGGGAAGGAGGPSSYLAGYKAGNGGNGGLATKKWLTPASGPAPHSNVSVTVGTGGKGAKSSWSPSSGSNGSGGSVTIDWN